MILNLVPKRVSARSVVTAASSSSSPLPFSLLHVATCIAVLMNRVQPFNANAIAQAGALAALHDDEHVARTVETNNEGLKLFHQAFEARGLRHVPSVANFVLVEVGDGDAVFQKMLKEGVIVRAMRGYKLAGWVRISVGTPSQNLRCLEVLDRALAD